MSGEGFQRPAATDNAQDVEERMTAARSLLRRPLIAATGPHSDELRLIRRHRVALTRFFAEGLGYRLAVEPAGARLYKPGLGRDSSRPLRRRSGAPFAPRAYALLVLTVAALSRLKSQLLVDELVAAVRTAAVEAGVDVDLDTIADRRALHAALMALVELGVLSERDGDLDHWAEGRTQSLLDVNRDLLGLLVSAPLGSIESVTDLLEPPPVPSSAGGARIAIRRHLVESPVLTVDELPDDHAEWWRRNRNREREWFLEQLGLELELRAEGALAVDPAEDLTDVDFPGRGATSHLALLLLEAMAAEVASAGVDAARDGTAAWRPVSGARVNELAGSLVAQWSSGLRRDQREDPSAARRQALELLGSLGLVRAAPKSPGSGDGWLVHAAAARYRPVARLTQRAGTGERSLFEIEEEA